MFKAGTLYTGIKSSGRYAEQPAMAEATKKLFLPFSSIEMVSQILETVFFTTF